MKHSTLLQATSRTLGLAVLLLAALPTAYGQTQPVRANDPPPIDPGGPEPGIISFSPTSGFVGGNVRILGVGVNSLQIYFGGAQATVVTNVSDTAVTVQVPVGAASGRIHYRVPGGTIDSTSGSFTVLQTPGGPPVITSFSPGAGAPGTRVRVRGTGFNRPDVKAFVGATPVVDLGISGDTLLTIIIPDGAASGKIKVATDRGTGLSGPYFVVTGRLAFITSFSPASARVGDTVTIRGKYLTGYRFVYFNGARANYTILLNDSTLRAQIPSGSTTGKILVQGASNQAYSATDLIIGAVPTITSFTPGSGPVGTRVRLRGRGLASPTSVKFGTVAATNYASSGDTLLTVIVPAGAIGSSQIFVTSLNGMGHTGAYFPITPPYAIITGFNPGSAHIGDSVRILGQHFTGATAVRFNGAGATFTIVSDSVIKARISTGSTTGKVTVQTSYNNAMSTTNFVIATAPAITSFSPGGGPVGEKVRIRGRGFTGVSQVQFGTTTATQIFPSGDTLITALVPAGAATGRVSVTVFGLTALSGPYFVVFPRPFLTVGSVTPGSGPIEQAVTLRGKYFTGTRFVRFNGTPAMFTIVSDSVLQTSVPTGATSGTLAVMGPYNTFNAPSFTVTATTLTLRTGLNEELLDDQATVWPNPSQNTTMLQLPDADLKDLYTVTVYTPDGRQALRTQVAGSLLSAGYRMEHNLPSSLYIISLVGSNGSERRVRMQVSK